MRARRNKPRVDPVKLFALIGAAGYIARRHMAAVKDTGNHIVAALDKNDSVGIIDSYFPDADFFTEFERFDRHIEMLRHEKRKQMDYVSICSPNYLHDSHIRFALRIGADAICEKPLVIKPWNLDALAKIEKETGRRIYTILQLRLHPSLIALKHRLATQAPGKKHDVDLTYITGRGKWYLYSWKGDPLKSGGLATNIGIHFFDMLVWLFGMPTTSRVHVREATRAAGYLELERARVRWFLSIDRADLPAMEGRPSTFRSITLDGADVDFSDGFSDLHTESYRHILAGKGFGVHDARASIQITHDIRESRPSGLAGDYHPRAAGQ